MTNDDAQAAAKQWAGEAGGKLCPQLTENELAAIVNEALSRPREYTHAIGDAGHKYFTSFMEGFEVRTPGTFAFYKLWDAMDKAARLPDNAI